MLDAKLLQSILGELENNGDKFRTIFDRAIKLAVVIIQNTEELREEINDHDEIFQTYITDEDMQFWLQIAEGNIKYGQGIHKDASVQIWLSKDMILKILRGNIMGAEAYMKGSIKAHGSLTQGLKYIKLYRLFFEYMRKKYQLKGYPG